MRIRQGVNGVVHSFYKHATIGNCTQVFLTTILLDNLTRLVVVLDFKFAYMADKTRLFRSHTTELLRYLSKFSTRPECLTFTSGAPFRVPPRPPPEE